MLECSWDQEYFRSVEKLTGFTYFAREPKYSEFHEHSKNQINFLNEGTMTTS